jgi:hypothetical protein
MYGEIYDLLGYGGLTPEIVEYLMGLLTPPAPLAKGGARESEFRPVQLFKRLENFYLRWCDGEFIDALQDNYPQKKMSQLQGQGIKTGVRQVDVYAGLNVMILLLELHRYGQSRDDLKAEIIFHPCGQEDTEDFDRFRLLRLISYSQCFNAEAFLSTVGSYLSGAFLNGAFLSTIFLVDVDLRGAALNGTDLRGTALNGADLSGAALNGANLSGADLSSGANLTGANLTGANFTGANLTGATLENIIWDEETKWGAVLALETAFNVPEALKQQLGLG